MPMKCIIPCSSGPGPRFGRVCARSCIRAAHQSGDSERTPGTLRILLGILHTAVQAEWTFSAKILKDKMSGQIYLLADLLISLLVVVRIQALPTKNYKNERIMKFCKLTANFHGRNTSEHKPMIPCHHDVRAHNLY